MASEKSYEYELLPEDVSHPDYLFKVIIIGDTGTPRHHSPAPVQPLERAR